MKYLNNIWKKGILNLKKLSEFEKDLRQLKDREIKIRKIIKDLFNK